MAGPEGALARDGHGALALGPLARGTARDAAHEQRGDERVEDAAAREARPRRAVAAQRAQHRVRQAVGPEGAVRGREVRAARRDAAQGTRPKRHRRGDGDALREEERGLHDERGGPRKGRGVRTDEAQEREADAREHGALPRAHARPRAPRGARAEHALGLEPRERAPRAPRRHGRRQHAPSHRRTARTQPRWLLLLLLLLLLCTHCGHSQALVVSRLFQMRDERTKRLNERPCDGRETPGRARVL